MGRQVFYKLTKEEREANNHQAIAPAIIVAAWENEYTQNSEDPDFHYGLNLKVITDGEKDIWKTSVKRCLKGRGADGNPSTIEEGTYFYGGMLCPMKY